MRVLVVLDNADRYLTLWETLPELGVDVHVVAPVGVASRLNERPGLTVHPVRDRFLRGGRETWRIIPGLRRITRLVDPDLVHLTGEPWSIAALQCLATRRPVVVHGAETLYRSGARPEIVVRSLLCRWNLRRLAGYVGWNSLAVDAARHEGLPATTPTLVVPAEVPDPAPYGAARTARRSYRTEAGWADADVVVGFVGRYAPEKGLAWLLGAFDRSTDSSLRLACFGAGNDAARLHAVADASGGRIHDHGPVPPMAIPTVMASIDVLVVPSTTTQWWVEQFGRVVIEAMLAGTPVVVSDSGALPEVVGDAAAVVPEGDVDALAGVLDRLAGDARARHDLAERGRRRAGTDFAPDRLAARLSSFWHTVTGSTTVDDLHTVAPRTIPVIAVLIASHDRRATTLRCLERLGSQTATARLEVFLVDDASTDGTAAAVAERFPDVHLLGGTGDLYWSGSMRIAESEARRVRPDFLLWLNDDVDLDVDAVERLLAAHRRLVERGDSASIVVGAVTDPESGEAAYSGRSRVGRGRRTRFLPIAPTDELQRCDTMNGNLVLVPELVYRRLEGFDGSYRHALSDFDFGLRATQQGCGVWLAPGTFGTCAWNHRRRQWSNPDVGFGRRVRMLLSPKGLPPDEWWRFTRRHAGRLWPLYFVSPYARFAAGALLDPMRRTRHRSTAGIGR